MDATQTEVTQRADISFMVVVNGTQYAPILVQRTSFNSRVGSSSARKTYQTAYAPKDFPFATRVVSDDSWQERQVSGSAGGNQASFATIALRPGEGLRGTMEMTKMAVEDCIGAEVTFAAILAAQECGDFDAIEAAQKGSSIWDDYVANYVGNYAYKDFTLALLTRSQSDDLRRRVLEEAALLNHNRVNAEEPRSGQAGE